MGKETISSIKQRFDLGQVTEKEIAHLKTDHRKGVQQLIKRYEKEKWRLSVLEEKFQEMRIYEKKQYENGKKYIAGVDEVGRGPLAGPVVAAAVILPSDFKLLGLNDSKLVNEKQRNEFYEIIKEQAVHFGISVINNEQIDRLNILKASKLAMREAISQLTPYPDHLLIDAVHISGVNCTQESIIKGDMKSISIAAASILAKVTRDKIMKVIHQEYPMYHFKDNMGYGTNQHMESLLKYGPTPYHRVSFSPVQQLVKKA